MGRPSHLRPIRLTLFAGAALALLAGMTACSGGGNSSGAQNQAAGGDGPPAVMVSGLDDLAEKAGCTGKLTGQTKAKELNQGVCKTAQSRYTLLTFASDEGQKAWLKEAKEWGGVYLVGLRWIAVSEEPSLVTLRKDLGGQIEKGRTH